MLKKSIIAFAVAFIYSALAFTVSAQGIPKPGEQFQAMSMDGMWTWYGEPKAMYYEGTHRRTYMTWTMNDGNKQVAYYDHDTKATATAITPKMPYNGSDHNHPAIFVRPDGKILIFCTGHDGGEITELISTNPEDITSWEAPRYPGGDGGYCYPNVTFLSAEGTKGRIYFFFRDEYLEPWFCTSDDWGETWSGKTHLFHIWTYPDNAYKPYVKYASNGKDEIHMAIERQNRAGNSAVKPVYFAKYKGGSFYQADGSLIATMAQLPMLDKDIDTVFYANLWGCSNTCYDIAIDEKNNPVIVFSMFEGADINIYWYVRWTGTAWFKKPLINSGAYRGAQSGFSAGITLDHENPNILYLARQILTPSATPFNLQDTSYANYKNNLKTTCWNTVGAVHEIDRWVTKDGGVTWDSIAITRGSLNKNMLPCVPRNHKPNMKVDCIWLNGIYTSMSPDGYDCAVRMFPFKDGESLPTTAAQPVMPPAQTPRVMLCNGTGMTFFLTRPEKASCKIYSLNGRLIADLTHMVRTMNAGRATLPFSSLRAVSGASIVDLDNGSSRTVKSLIINK